MHFFCSVEHYGNIVKALPCYNINVGLSPVIYSGWDTDCDTAMTRTKAILQDLVTKYLHASQNNIP